MNTRKIGEGLADWLDASALALSLSDRLLVGAPQLKQFEMWPVGWQPIDRKCHENADRWLLSHPDWRVARGWILQANEPRRGANYVAHSVVTDLEGHHWDVTLIDRVERQFLVHLGDLQAYTQLAIGGPWAIVREPLPDGICWQS